MIRLRIGNVSPHDHAGHETKANAAMIMALESYAKAAGVNTTIATLKITNLLERMATVERLKRRFDVRYCTDNQT